MSTLEQAANERRRKWLRIQAEAPEIASFLTEINKTFGKPKNVMVQIGGERIL